MSGTWPRQVATEPMLKSGRRSLDCLNCGKRASSERHSPRNQRDGACALDGTLARGTIYDGRTNVRSRANHGAGIIAQKPAGECPETPAIRTNLRLSASCRLADVG